MQEPKVSFVQIVKHPVTYALVVIASLLMFFVYQYAGSNEQNDKNCQAEKEQLRKELAQERADKSALVTALLIKNNIIYKQEQDKKELDSALRDGPGKKAKKIIKEE